VTFLFKYDPGAKENGRLRCLVSLFVYVEKIKRLCPSAGVQAVKRQGCLV